eukprot:6461089-Amphidinium_carterae.2
MVSTVRAVSVVDDRLLTSATLHALCDAWKASEKWDQEQKWEINVSKSFVFTADGSRTVHASWGGKPLPHAYAITWYGHQIHTMYNLPRIVLEDRTEAACAVLRTIARGPGSIPTKAIAVEVVALSKVAFGVCSPHLLPRRSSTP